MNQFKLTITNQVDDFDLYFDIFETNIAKKWKLEIENAYSLFETERFTNWPNSLKTRNYYTAELNKQIDIINFYHPNSIDAVFDENATQETMNYLHKFFEVLRGPVNEGTEWYNNANPIAQDALSQYNVLIHEYEHFCFNETAIKETNHPYATIVGTYHCERHCLTDGDYGHFTFKWKFGTVYINYCEIGKPLLDVFKDNDQIVGSNNIKPLQYYSADFQIKFGPSTLDHVYNQRVKDFCDWYDRKANYLCSLGLFRSNRLALGLIPVASLNIKDSRLENLSEVEIIQKLSKYNRIKSTCIK